MSEGDVREEDVREKERERERYLRERDRGWWFQLSHLQTQSK